MQSKQPEILHAVQLLPLVVVGFALVIASGCAQEKQVEKKPASPPSAQVDFDGPGNRLDAAPKSVSPE